MFKVISAEFKKIFSKPGIFILSVLLAIILILGVFLYNPKLNEDTSIKFEGQTNFTSKYDYFIGDDETYGIKAKADNNVELVISNINNYLVINNGTKITQKENISLLLNNIDEKFKEYTDCSIDGLESTIIKTRTDLVYAFETLNQAISYAYSNAANGSYSLLMTENQYNEYTSQYKEILKWANTVVQKADLAEHCYTYKTKYKTKFLTTINDFVYPTLSKQFIDSYTTDSNNSALNTLNNRLSAIMDEINTNLAIAQNDSSKNIQLSDKMTELAQLYVDTCETFSNLVKYELICNAFDNVSVSEHNDVLYLSNYSAYNANSLLVRYSYLFDNNKTTTDYATPLAIGNTSNLETNAYDYAYFVLKLFSFVLISFAIMSACNTIAGEIKDGSMRYLAIRPVTRTKILFGKFLSIMSLSFILAIFGGIIAICVGGAVYGFSTLPILTIFNGTTAVTFHPIVMISIYLLSMLIELAIYTAIALFVSSLIKSDLLAVTILIGLYLINTLLPVFVVGINSWLAFYPFSHISLYSLFGSSVYVPQGNFLSLLLGAKVYGTTNIILTSSLTLILLFTSLFFANKIFNNKEL